MMAKRYCKDGHKDQQWQIDSDLDHQYGKLINLSLSLATNPDQTIILWHFPHPNGVEQTLARCLGNEALVVCLNRNQNTGRFPPVVHLSNQQILGLLLVVRVTAVQNSNSQVFKLTEIMHTGPP